jgi:hypothetical protein
MAAELWGGTEIPDAVTTRSFGKGKIFWGGQATIAADESLYPPYYSTGSILAKLGILEDFSTTGHIRYTHRTTDTHEVYFVANRTGQKQNAFCTFNTTAGAPELWDAVTGKMRRLPQFEIINGQTRIPMVFEGDQSFFVVFRKSGIASSVTGTENFPSKKLAGVLNGPWNVSFDTAMGGPSTVRFDKLTDWSLRPEAGIKYYSGIGVYRQQFDAPTGVTQQTPGVFLDLGEVKNLARVKLNGKDLGVVWTTPWQVDITGIVLKKDNVLEIEVANLWPNRLIGDEQQPYDGVVKQQWPQWYKNDEKRPTSRYTFTTWRHYNKNSPLLSSGLLGPITILTE